MLAVRGRGDRSTHRGRPKHPYSYLRARSVSLRLLWFGTTNLDKWSSPWPVVAVADMTALALTFIVLFPVLKRRSQKS